MLTVLLRDDENPEQMWSAMTYPDGIVIERRVMGQEPEVRRLSFAEEPEALALLQAERDCYLKAGFRSPEPEDELLLTLFYMTGGPNVIDEGPGAAIHAT